MIVSALATLLLAFAAMMPGFILCRSERLGGAELAAVAAASLALSMMVTALLGLATQTLAGAGLPAAALFPVSLALTIATYLITPSHRWISPKVEWQIVVVAALFVLQGVVTYALSINDQPDGSLQIHAWYNADWFKHIGHVFGIADYGLPAKDIFGNARPLHYYWLSYVPPGAATSLTGDAWTALYAVNVIYSGLLAATLYGAVRLSGASKNISAVVATLATMISATPATWSALLKVGGFAAMLHNAAPPEPAFISLALYIPQHALALTLLLGWGILSLGHETPAKRIRILAVAALATVMTVSTLFGGAILATYGFTELYRRKFVAIPELAAMAVVSVTLVFALGIVSFADPIASAPAHNTIVRGFSGNGGLLGRGLISAVDPIGQCGLPILVCLYLAWRWTPATSIERSAKVFALALAFTAVLSAFVAEIAIGNLVAHEIRLRMINLIAVSAAIIGGWAVSRAWREGRREKIAATAVLAALVVAAAPTIIVRMIWHANHQDNFTTIIPADDRKVLAVLKAKSATRDVVWQYPENSLLSPEPGDDTWSVVLAGRANLATMRATDWSAAAEDVELARRYFNGEDVPVPLGTGWIYLSRKLHPRSYDALVARLDSDAKWKKNACEQDACLFRRQRGS